MQGAVVAPEKVRAGKAKQKKKKSRFSLMKNDVTLKSKNKSDDKAPCVNVAKSPAGRKVDKPCFGDKVPGEEAKAHLFLFVLILVLVVLVSAWDEGGESGKQVLICPFSFFRFQFIREL